MTRTHRLVCLLAFALTCTASLTASLALAESPQTDSEGITLFEQKIKPVLIERCYECHSGSEGEIEAGLELDSPTGMRRGGDSGPMLVAHDTGKSPLLSMLRHDDDVEAMPPDEKLDDEVIAAFEQWIRLGAPDSRKETGPTARQQRLQAGLNHWAFKPPKSVESPNVKRADWPQGWIDNFVLSAMEAKGLQPVADANRRTLVRRVYFDLIGLPPTPQQVKQFLADQSPDAFAKLVDSLLDSPRFGERWGRHWLDVVRYAESSGMEFNFTYPHAWPYRDYVINALNDDKPYDQFLREQIAGDRLPVDEQEESESIEARQIATSMLAFGPKRHNSSGTEFRMDVADDQIDTVFRSTQALTVACARCHDHKFDAIPTKDYYALAGIFLSTEPLYGSIKQKYSNNPTDLLPIGSGAQTKHDAAENFEKTIVQVETQLAETRKQHGEATAAEKLAFETQTKASKVVETQIAALQDGATAGPEAAAALDGANTALQLSVEKVAELNSQIAAQEADLKTKKSNRPPRPAYAMSVRDRAKPADTKLAIRGDFRDRGEVVPRGFLSAVKIDGDIKVDTAASGRLELANWIANAENPLTARVMVNRIWHHLFGRGLVASVDNFGMIGKQPSHPELLDSLAIEFVETGWSVKRMIRTIMLSRAYQLSYHVDAANAKIDPENRFFWRATPRRLEAEAIRDAMLAVSGQLKLDRPIGSTVTGLGDQLVRGIATDKIQPPSDHRSVYLPIVRDYVPEIFDLFDFPSPSLVSGSRSVTNVPAQALYLRNSAFVADQAKHAARRLLSATQASDDAGRAELAIRWTLSRQITAAEREGALGLVAQIRVANANSDDREVDAWAAWFHTLFTTAEFRYLVDLPSQS